METFKSNKRSIPKRSSLSAQSLAPIPKRSTFSAQSLAPKRITLGYTSDHPLSNIVPTFPHVRFLGLFFSFSIRSHRTLRFPRILLSLQSCSRTLHRFASSLLEHSFRSFLRTFVSFLIQCSTCFASAPHAHSASITHVRPIVLCLRHIPPLASLGNAAHSACFVLYLMYIS